MSADATNGKYGEQTRVAIASKCDVPPAPPPYHIAAAFSKKAALFQQFNNRMLSLFIKTNELKIV